MFSTLLSWLAPAGPRAGLCILIFHRVYRVRDELFPDEVTAPQFDAICGWLKDWFNVLPLSYAAERLAAGTLPSRPLAITFDDGYADNHDIALPILQRHGLSATFFVATGFLDGGRMWNDTVIEAVRRCEDDELDLDSTIAGSLGRLPLTDAAARRAAVDSIIAHTKYLEPADRASWVDAIAERSRADLPRNLMMSSDQVRSLHRSGMDIGGHTVNHPIIRNLDREAALREIVDGRRQLQDLTGTAVEVFAYPNGRPGVDYGDETVELVRSQGFRAAVTTDWRVARAGDDPMQLPRFTPWDRSRVRFGARLSWALACR